MFVKVMPETLLVTFFSGYGVEYEHEMQTIPTDVPVCLSVNLSVTTLQKRLNGSRSCSSWRLLSPDPSRRGEGKGIRYGNRDKSQIMIEVKLDTVPWPLGMYWNSLGSPSVPSEGRRSWISTETGESISPRRYGGALNDTAHCIHDMNAVRHSVSKNM